MSNFTLNLSPKVYDYLQKTSLREPEILQELRDNTARRPGAQMQISPEQGQFMALLMELLQAKKALDIGTFTGYSALVVALSLPADGRVISCDIDEKTSSVAQSFWQAAGVSQKIELCLGPALDTLENLLRKGEGNTFDFAFIDADKANYAAYYEYAYQLVRKGGLIAIDNTLWDGKVADLNENDNSTCAIRELNAKLLQDKRVSLSMIPIGDGLTLALKR